MISIEFNDPKTITGRDAFERVIVRETGTNSCMDRKQYSKGTYKVPVSSKFHFMMVTTKRFNLKKMLSVGETTKVYIH